MTNPAEDFTLDAELAQTAAWEADDSDSDSGDTEAWESGYADFDPDDPEEVTTGDLDLAARHELRRVAGLRTELEDITEVEYRQLRLERVVLVGVWTEGSAEQARISLEELARLAETAGSQVLDGLVQRRSRPDPATYIGAGKVDELQIGRAHV